MAIRRLQGRNARSRAFAALAGGALVVLPTVTSSGIPMALRAADPPAAQAAPNTPELPPGITLPPIGVDGSLPQPPVPQALGVPGYPNGPGSATTAGPLGIPDSMLRAYHNAADIMAREQPGCHVDWALIAAIGRVESNHARGGYVDARGNTLERILGPVLDGTGGFAAIRDTDHGRYDGDPVWDRAVGATQFIPSTWASYASDGNGDGVSDPNNVYDETLATARYLCSGGLDLSSDANQRLAVRRYNNSQSYVDTVMAYAYGYRNGVSKLPDSPVPIGAPPGPGAVEAAAGSPAGDVAPPAPPVTPAQPATPNQPGQPGTPTQLPGSSTAPASSSPAKPTSTAPTTPTTPTTPTSPSPTSPTSTTPTSTTPSSSAPANPATPTTTTTTSSTTTQAPPTH